MNKQVEMMIPYLRENGQYLFDHIRKGPFVGIYKGQRPAPEGDEADTIFLEIDVYTEDGSGQERLSNAYIRDSNGNKRREVYTPKLIRPSLLRSITSPSKKMQNELIEKYTAQQQRAPDSQELPKLSLPTEQAMQLFDTPQAAERSVAWWKKLMFWSK